MCSGTLNPGGEVRECSVGCRLGMPDVSPFVFIARSYQVHAISWTNEILFQAGVFWGLGERFWLPGRHEIVILFPLRIMPV